MVDYHPIRKGKEKIEAVSLLNFGGSIGGHFFHFELRYSELCQRQNRRHRRLFLFFFIVALHNQLNLPVKFQRTLRVRLKVKSAWK